MNDIYTTLTFENSEEFEMYDNAVNLSKYDTTLNNRKFSNVGVNKDYKITVFIRTDIPLPTGILTANTRSGKEIKIRVASGRPRIVDSCN